jgi:hypothetical protein
MLKLATQSERYTAPYPRDAASIACGPGRRDYIRRIYALVAQAGRTVWGCEVKYGELHVRVDLPKGKANPIWEDLYALWNAAQAACEVCGALGTLRNDRDYWSVLCDAHP